jgi:manganese/zinc/iron transport system permease protein
MIATQIQFATGLLTDFTTQTIGVGTAVLGMMSGLLGVYATLRKQSLLGDAVAHAALPGIALAFLLTGTKNIWIILAGAAFSGWVATFWISGITFNTKLKSDTAMALVLAVFFGFGLVLLTHIQRLPNANQSGLETFLFGQAATLLRRDVYAMLAIAGIALTIVLLFWKEFKLFTFDPAFSKALGFNNTFLEFCVNFLIVLAIVTGLQTVGVILMSALLIAPATAARQWTNNLITMVILSAFFGILAGLTGTVISGAADNLPTGPLIVLVSVSIVFISFIIAPERGWIGKIIMANKNRKNLSANNLIARLFEICNAHQNKKHPHTLAIIKTIPGFTMTTFRDIQRKGLVQMNDNDEWCLTDKGISIAKSMYPQKDKSV